MAGTIIDYLKEYGNIPFAEMPMNDVDSLILCQLSYLKFDGMVPGVRENAPSVTLQELAEREDYEKLFADERFEKDNRALFEGMIGGSRFRSLRLNCYVNMVEKEWETQFSAITFLLEDNTPYIAFRGTDETIVGWKEDFNMAFLSPVPGQAYSVKYLNIVTEKLHAPFYMGGHSKGGNLAVYSAMQCTQQARGCIQKIYSMDGPGFRPEVLAECDYDGIADKVVKILPHSSVIGMLFESDTRYKVVESKTFGLAQHNPFTWKVEGTHFVQADHIYKSRRRLDGCLNEWILSLDEHQLRTFVDTLYQVVSASQAEDLIAFSADWKKSMNGIIAALREVDEQTVQMLREMVRSLFEIGRVRMRAERRPRRRRAAKEALRREQSGKAPNAQDAIACRE